MNKKYITQTTGNIYTHAIPLRFSTIRQSSCDAFRPRMKFAMEETTTRLVYGHPHYPASIPLQLHSSSGGNFQRSWNWPTMRYWAALSPSPIYCALVILRWLAALASSYSFATWPGHSGTTPEGPFSTIQSSEPDSSGPWHLGSD